MTMSYELGRLIPHEVSILAEVLDPLAFAPLPDRANLGQRWSQIDRQMTAHQHAERALTAGYKVAATPSMEEGISR